jgi:hypothetical protein
VTLRVAAIAGALAAGGLVLASPAGATNECRGLNPCVPVAGPWVVVPVGKGSPRPQVQYQLTCPRGFVVGGVDAELTDRAIDIAFIGASGSPVSPGVTTSRTIVFVGSFVGRAARAPTFRPHIGCIPAAGGGRRTPTGRAAVFPPGQATTRRIATVMVTSTRRIAVTCRADEDLVAWYVARGFATPTPPSPALVGSLSVKAASSGDQVVAVARAAQGRGIVQVSAVCAGGGR